jgi:hypothetical protein
LLFYSKFVIDYIIVNEELKPNLRDTGVFRGNETDDGHSFVESKFKFCRHILNHRKYNQTRRIHNVHKQLKFHMLEEESARLLYQNILSNKLNQTIGNIEEDWINVKQATKLEAPCGSLG